MKPTQISHPGMVAARKCVATRRVMLGAWGNETFGLVYALDLMGVPGPEHLTSASVEFARCIAQTNVNSLAAATLYVADPEMVDLLDVAAPTMPDQALDDTDPLTPHGFLWLSEPLTDRSAGGGAPIRAISWSLLDSINPILADREKVGPAVLIHTYSNTLDHARARGLDVDSLAPGAPSLIPASSTAWQVGSLIGEVFGEAPPEGADADPGFYQRLLAAFWTLSRQPLTETDDVPAGTRSDRRRGARAGVEDPGQPIRVVSLRRCSTNGKQHASGTGRTVGVRFPVRGFWRNQWLPSTETHRQQYIAPHWRGPENAPVQGGERVFLAEGDSR